MSTALLYVRLLEGKYGNRVAKALLANSLLALRHHAWKQRGSALYITRSIAVKLECTCRRHADREAHSCQLSKEQHGAPSARLTLCGDSRNIAR